MTTKTPKETPEWTVEEIDVAELAEQLKKEGKLPAK
jgi:hypothetical protein